MHSGNSSILSHGRQYKMGGAGGGGEEETILISSLSLYQEEKGHFHAVKI